MIRFYILVSLFLFIDGSCCKKLTCNEHSAEEPRIKFEVEFHFCTPEKENCMQYDPSESSLNLFLKQRSFHADNNTVFIIHGFLKDIEATWMTQMKNKFKEWDPTMNIVLVDWSNAFVMNWNVFNYRHAALATEAAAKGIARKLKDMATVLKTPLTHWGKLHLIGHSLGAHVAAQTARLLKTGDYSVPRVTGLDPAYPCFQDETASLRLKKSDAQFIDIIHTNSGDKHNPNFGIFEPIGHLDFYVNGGNNQPRCNASRQGRTLEEWKSLIPDVLSFLTRHTVKIDARNITENILFEGKYLIMCDHEEAPKFFTDSLKGKDFLSTPVTNFPVTESLQLMCRNKACKKGNKKCVEMGINAEKYRKSHSGPYYVDTIKKTDCSRVKF